MAIPEEIRAAKRINSEGERIIEKAQEEAETIVARAQEQAAFLIEERGLTHFHWDLDPKEYKTNDPVKAVAYVEKQLGKMTGRNVLLMHDVKQATVKAIPEILDWIDAENARRVADHKRPIRIIQSPELAIERLPDGLLAWVAEAMPTTLGARLASAI